MAVEIYDTTVPEAERFAAENGIAYQYAEHIGDGIVWLYNDDVSDNLQLVLNDGKQGIYWDSAEDNTEILHVFFDTLEGALRAYDAIMQEYRR